MIRGTLLAEDRLYGPVQISDGAVISIDSRWTAAIYEISRAVEVRSCDNGLSVKTRRAEWYVDVVDHQPDFGDAWHLVSQQLVADDSEIALHRDDSTDAGAVIGATGIHGPANVVLLQRQAPLNGVEWFRVFVDSSCKPLASGLGGAFHRD